MQLAKAFVTCKNYIERKTPKPAFCFQRKKPKCKYGFAKFCALRPKWLTQKWLSVYVCSAHQNVVLQWTWTWHAKTRSRRSFAILRATKASCVGLNPVLVLQLWENFLIRNSTDMKMMRNLINVSGTLRVEQYWQPLQPLTKNTKRLWLMLLMI